MKIQPQDTTTTPNPEQVKTSGYNIFSDHNSTSQQGGVFELVADYTPAGDQPKVIDEITDSLKNGNQEQTILGVTGCGKTYIMANIINNLQRPALVIAHNKTLAAQLAEEFKRFFPNNSVHYFVSYYDYYQPESYIPKTDTFIEKQTQINEEIERLRNASTQALLTRKDVIIVSSVSCIYGLGNPEDYQSLKLELLTGQNYNLSKLTRRLVDMQFNRTNMDLKRGLFRVRGEMLEIYPSNEENIGVRLVFWGDQLELIERFDILTNRGLGKLDGYMVFPAKQYVTTMEKIQNAVGKIDQDLHVRLAELENDNKLLAAERLKQRTMNDTEMLLELGFCGGIENYSSYFDGRVEGEPPSTLLDYFPDNCLTFVDESHITLPQIGAMYAGDRSRKTNLIDYGFRLPSALNNRPLRRHEFEQKVGQRIYVSATPGPYELGQELVNKED
ncbi:MAG: DEAD/DEAH box helicase family protein [Candidatus Parcubacteria bacterium]|nr:DEAD/DEAH box helicase family protein [Candidatus Paceibacterota bacterium]